MDKKTIKKKYKIQDEKELDKYIKWCRSKGWRPGCGVQCNKSCKYRTAHNNTVDSFCNYMYQTGKRRPCPPWDCTLYEKGTRRNVDDRL